MGGFWLLAFCVFAFVPLINAHSRLHRQKFAIGALAGIVAFLVVAGILYSPLLLIALVAWIVAFVWSCSNDVKKSRSAFPFAAARGRASWKGIATKTLVMMTAALLALGSSPVSGSASAQDGISDRERQALNNTQHEMTTCAAYYMLARQCVINRGRASAPKDAQAIQQTTAAMERLLKDAQEIGRSIGMTPDAMKSRVNIEAKMMMSLTNNDCVNISSAISRYEMRCKQVLENPDSIFSEYVKLR